MQVKWPCFQVCRLGKKVKIFTSKKTSSEAFIHSPSKYLFSALSVLSILLGAGDPALNKTDRRTMEFLRSWTSHDACV